MVPTSPTSRAPRGGHRCIKTPYHVARSKLFVRECSAKALIRLDITAIEANIEHTRFPVPEDEQHDSTDDFPGLVRAADLIGQLADINYLRKPVRKRDYLVRAEGAMIVLEELGRAACHDPSGYGYYVTAQPCSIEIIERTVKEAQLD